MGKFEKNSIRELLLEDSLCYRQLLTIDYNHFISKSEELVTINVDSEVKLDLFILLLAITHVKPNYLYINECPLDDEEYDNTKNVEEKRKNNSLYERTFAYELYRQWQNMLEVMGSSLHVDAEIGKKLSNDSIDFEKLKLMKGDYKEPDLVLHNSQANTEGQTFVCEIKRNIQLNPEKILQDIIKLCHFLDSKIWGGNPYKYGLFIVVNMNFTELKEQIKKIKDQIIRNIKDENLDVNMSKIICFSYSGTSVDYELFSNIMEV